MTATLNAPAAPALIHPAVLPLLSCQWAMEPNAQAQIERQLLSIPHDADLSVYEAHKAKAQGQLYPKGQARYGYGSYDSDDDTGSGQRQRKPYPMVGGVALVGLSGFLQKDADWIMRYLGGTSTRAFAVLLGQAMGDPDVSAVCLLVDSGGGTVDGTFEAAAAVWAARQSGRKPLVASIDGMGCSAAYWIACQCAQVYIGPTSWGGSIGTKYRLVDSSAAYELMGIKFVDITTGTYKASGADGQPVTDEDKAYWQGLADAQQVLFSAGVVRGRKLAAATVKSLASEARVYIGQATVDAGLADGVASAVDVVRTLQKQVGKSGGRMSADWGSRLATQLAEIPHSSDRSQSRNPQPPANLGGTRPTAKTESLRGTGAQMDNLGQKLIAAILGHGGAAQAEDGDELEPSAQVTALQGQVGTLTGQNATLLGQNATLVSSNQTLQAANDGLTAQIATLKGEMEAMKGDQTKREADALAAAKTGAKAAAVTAFGAGSERLKQAEALIDSQTSASALGAMQEAYRAAAPAGLTPNGTRQTLAAGVTPTEDAGTDSDFYAGIKNEGAQANGTAQK